MGLDDNLALAEGRTDSNVDDGPVRPPLGLDGTGIDAGRDQQWPVGTNVRCGEAERPASGGSCLHRARNSVGTSEIMSSSLDVAETQRLANLRGGHRHAIDDTRRHDNQVETEARSELFEEGRVAAAYRRWRPAREIGRASC